MTDDFGISLMLFVWKLEPKRVYMCEYFKEAESQLV